jgi:uncharacterized protein (TIGR02453 family)
MAFGGYPAEALPFLKALAFHQTRDWFEANRPTYLAALKQPTEALVEALDAACREEGLPFAGSPKRSVFRIHRDVRFSKNKDPYKTNVGFSLNAGAEKSPHGVFYCHVDPTGCFFAAGSYMPEPPRLMAFRKAIAARPDRFLAIVASLAAKGLTLSDELTLSRAPKGFEAADPAVADALKLKSFTVSRPFPDVLLADGPALIAAALAFIHDTLPLTHFVREVGDGAV